MATTSAPPIPPSRDFGSLGLSCLHALMFAWAGLTLPWDNYTIFALCCGAASLSHFVLAVALLLQRWRLQRIAWRIVLWFGVGFLLVYGGGLVWAGIYLIGIYGSLGAGMAAGALAATSCIVLFTLPMSMRAWRLAGPGLPHWRGAGALLAVIGGGLGILAGTNAAGETLLDPKFVKSRLVDDFGNRPRITAIDAQESVATQSNLDPVLCPPTASDADVRALVFHADTKPLSGSLSSMPPPHELIGRCVWLRRDFLMDDLYAALADSPRRGNAKIDILVEERRLNSPWIPPAPLSALGLRGGAEGVCLGAACFAPWQLVAKRAFSQLRPIKQIPDLQLGIDASALYEQLALPTMRLGDTAPPESELLAVDTVSLRLRADGSVELLQRLHPPPAAVNEPIVADASRRAQRYVLRSQLPNGVFRYSVDAYSGRSPPDRVHIARHAGTTLALCELGEHSSEVHDAVERALDRLAVQRRKVGKHVALVHPRDRVAHLGSTALPLSAFLICRERIGRRFDRLIGELGHTLLASQRVDGRFHVQLDLESGHPLPVPDTLYAYGQAILALVLLEGQQDAPDYWPKARAIAAAVTRAMDHVSGSYWDHGAAPFFFTEENWHCLAARAALPHHRHDAYERFCRNYVHYQARFLLDEDSDVDVEYLGGHGFGNLFAPYNTPTAGLLEATAAAAALARAREEDPQRELDIIAAALPFLINQQWRGEDCFACRAPEIIDGGFSQSMTLPTIRIDYVQHAWLGIAHGAAQLFAADDSVHR